MATLDETDSQSMSELLAKLGIKGEVSSLDDLKALIKPKTKSEIKKERLSHDRYVEDEEDDTETKTTVVPKLSWFCSSTPVPKGHVSFTAWKHEVEGLTTIYSKKAVIQSIKRSLKSPAAEVVWCLGQTATYEEILEVLETRYDDVAEGEVLLSELFSTTQSEKESLTEFASRLESILYRLSNMDDSRYDGGDPEILKVNFFRGLRDDRLREALRPRKDKLTTFNQMLKEARRLESDQSKRKSIAKVGIDAVTAEENKVSDRDWLEKRFQKMETKLQNEVKAQIASVQQTTSQPQQNNGQGRGRGGYRGRGNRGRYRGTHFIPTYFI